MCVSNRALDGVTPNVLVNDMWSSRAVQSALASRRLSRQNFKKRALASQDPSSTWFQSVARGTTF